MENTIDITGLAPIEIESLQALANAFRCRPLAKPPAPEKWTVERVLEGYPKLRGMFDEKLMAFEKLLACAHWANEGESGTKSLTGNFFVIYSTIKPTIEWWENATPSPLIFASRVCAEKFLSIEGIEPLLKTFFGI